MTPKSTIVVLLLLLFTACDGITIDNHEHYMEDVCKCEEFETSENLYIADKEGWVQPCARTINGMLKWGYVVDSDTCHTYLPFIYDDAFSFNHGLAPVRLQSKWGVIDTTGKTILDFKYTSLSSFSDSLTAFSNENNLYGFINTKGDTIIDNRFSEVSAFWGNLAFVLHPKNGWQVYNSKGKQMPVQIDSLVRSDAAPGLMVAASYGHLHDRTIYNEVIEYPFYSKGEKVRLVGFRNRYTVIPDTGGIILSTIESTFTPNKMKPIFE